MMTTFAILAFLAIFFGVLCGVLMKSHRGAAVAAFGLALAVAFGAGYLLMPMLQSTDLADELGRTRAKLSTTEQALAQSRIAEEEFQVDLSAERANRAELARTHQAFIESLKQEVVAIQAQYRDPARDLHLDPPSRGIEPPTVQAALLADVHDFRHIKARATTASIATTNSTPSIVAREPVRSEVEQLRHKLAQPVRTANYDIEPYPAPDLISGRAGKYYAIDLKDAEKGVRFYFEGGKYTLRTGGREFRTSLNQFISDVLGKMEGQVKYDLFVRGSADNKPYLGRVEREHVFKDIVYLRQVGEDRYSTEARTMRLDGDVVRNQDLPNLRAAFIRELVSTYPVKPPSILEGTVTPKRDDRDRNVELILFVAW